ISQVSVAEALSHSAGFVEQCDTSATDCRKSEPNTAMHNRRPPGAFPISQAVSLGSRIQRRSATMSLQHQDKSREHRSSKSTIEFAEIKGAGLKVSRVGLGTWAIGGWMWGGTDEADSIETIRAALALGLNVIDTAPVYGFGRSEEIVGKALVDGYRDGAVIATKVGLEWHEGKIARNSSRDRIMPEGEDSLRRLQTDRIDVYQVHWPDPKAPMAETANAMRDLFEQGTIRAVGVSNFSVPQMDVFREVAPIHVVQPPYNLFERGIERG